MQLSDNLKRVQANLLLLDPISLERIGCFFDSFGDVLNLSLVCKKLAWLRYSPRVWSQVVNNKYDLSIQAEELAPIKELCENLNNHGEDKQLRFVGLYTDGGTDQNLMRYWLDYAFSPYDWLYYCSEVGQNINCVGVLGGIADGSHPIDQQYSQYRDNLIEVCRPIAQHMLHNRLENMSIHELEMTCRELGNAVENNPAVALLVFRDMTQQQINQRRNELRQLTQQLSRQIYCKDKNILDLSEKKGDNLHLLDTSNMQCICNGSSTQNVGSINHLSFSRNSNFTCPVATGVLFMGVLHHQPYNLSPEDLQSKIQKMLNGESCKMFDDMKVQPQNNDYPVVNSGSSFAGIWSEFDVNWFVPSKDDSKLCGIKPVAWFHFFNLQEAKQCWIEYHQKKQRKFGGGFMSAVFGPQNPYSEDQKDLKGRDVLEISLTQKWIGNVVVLKLIQCENLMEYFNDNHPYPNVDIHNIKIQGSYIQLPEGVTVQDQQNS